MALIVTHKFVDVHGDGPDPTLVRPSNWNDTHLISGSLDPTQFPALSGDVSNTAGSTVITVSKTGGVSFAPSATTDTTNAANISSGTLPASRLPNPAPTTLGGIKSNTGAAHQWVKSINTDGSVSLSTPAYSDLTGNLPPPGVSSLGGVFANGGATHQWASSINTDGTVTFTRPAFTDISGTAASGQLPTPTTGAIGGVKAIAAASHEWINSIDTTGTPQLSQPAAADLSNGVTGSGAVVLQSSPTLITPTLGVAQGTSLALGGTFTAGWGDIVQVWDATSGSPITTAQPSLSIVKYEAISLIDTEGGQNSAIYCQVTSNNTSHSGGGAPITQANGITSKVTQNGSGGACAFIGIAIGGTDINGAFGAYFAATATHFPGGATAVGTNIFNSSGTDMPWSAFVPGTSSAALGIDLPAGGANLNTAAVEMRNDGNLWDVGIGAYGNSIKTAFLRDDSDSITVLQATASHTTGVDFSAATFTSANQVAVALGNNHSIALGTFGHLIARQPSDGSLLIGGGQAKIIFNSANQLQAKEYGAGTATFDSSGNITSVSDERLKHVQRKFSRGLSDIIAMDNPVYYKWRPESGMETEGEYVGFTAQGAMKGIPEAASLGPKGYYSFNDRPLLAAAINAIKELSKRIEELEARNARRRWWQ